MIEDVDNEFDDWEEFLEFCKKENKLVGIEVYKGEYVEFLEFIDYCFKFDEVSRFWESDSDEDENCKWFGLGCYVGFDFDEVYVR